MGLVGAGEADIDWDVAGAIGHRFNDRVSSVIGYRALGVDYSNDDGFLDVVQEGPILGLVVRSFMGTKSPMDFDCALSLQPLCPET